MKKILFFIFITVVYAQLHAQVFNLNTGVNNSSGNFIPFRDNDDTWFAVKPNGNNTYAKVCSAYPGWAVSNGCSQWITPDIANTGTGPSNTPNGLYVYRTTINVPTITTCTPITSAVLNLSSIAGDNDIQWFRINGHQYAIVPGVKNFLSFISQTVNINTSHIVSGVNTLEIDVDNTTLVSGLNLCGDLTLTRTPVTLMVPSITGSSTYCQGGQLSFTGSDGLGTANSFFWEILEWNTSTNTPTTGGYSWSNWYTGSPGNFTFPIASLLPCNRTYKVKLAVSNACQSWVETNKFIYFACNPVNAGPNQIVACPGNCVQIGTPGQSGYSYQWRNSSGAVIGNTAQITVCPIATSTYTLTVTNLAQNCSGTDNVTVFVNVGNNPDFNLTVTPTGSNYVTCAATPVVTNANTVAGFGEMYIVEEIDGSGNTVPGTRSSDGNNPNPPCWWVYPNTVNFKGYDGTKSSGVEDVANNANCHLVTPVPGKFRTCRYYRITRGTWNSNCPWAQQSKVVYYCPVEPGERGTPLEVKNVAAPDYSYLRYPKVAPASELTNGLVYPNPGKGLFTIATAQYKGGSLVVYNPVGQAIKQVVLGKNQANLQLDLTGREAGTYTVRITTPTGSYVEKLVLAGQ